MSKNIFSSDQSKEIFDTVQNATDKVASLEELADRFLTEPKNLKLHLQRKYPDNYNDWFGVSTKADSKELTKKELVDRLIDIIDFEPTKRDWIRSTVAKSSFPQPFAQELYTTLVDNKIDDYLKEVEWLNKLSRVYTQWFWFWILMTVACSIINLLQLTGTAQLGEGLNETTVFGLDYVNTMRWSMGAINLGFISCIYITYKVRTDTLKQKDIAINNLDNLIDSLPSYMIDEFKERRLEGGTRRTYKDSNLYKRKKRQLPCC